MSFIEAFALIRLHFTRSNDKSLADFLLQYAESGPALTVYCDVATREGWKPSAQASAIRFLWNVTRQRTAASKRWTRLCRRRGWTGKPFRCRKYRSGWTGKQLRSCYYRSGWTSKPLRCRYCRSGWTRKPLRCHYYRSGWTGKPLRCRNCWRCRYKPTIQTKDVRSINNFAPIQPRSVP